MLLFLGNDQIRYSSNLSLHIFLIQNRFYINFQTFFVVVIDLLSNNNLNFIADWYNWDCYHQ